MIKKQQRKNWVFRSWHFFWSISYYLACMLKRKEKMTIYKPMSQILKKIKKFAFLNIGSWGKQCQLTIINSILGSGAEMCPLFDGHIILPQIKIIKRKTNKEIYRNPVHITSRVTEYQHFLAINKYAIYLALKHKV